MNSHPTFEWRRRRSILISLKHRRKHWPVLSGTTAVSPGWICASLQHPFCGKSALSGLDALGPIRQPTPIPGLSRFVPHIRWSSAFDALQLLLLRMMSVPSGAFQSRVFCLLDTPFHGAEQTGAGARNWRHLKY
ncbi:hypothetical protein CGRA01v4_06208 [Colletotrichum graminicola]|nr:hypothetical protein CGRA01v4_06208 [Colletotrichum graminicola]